MSFPQSRTETRGGLCRGRLSLLASNECEHPWDIRSWRVILRRFFNPRQPEPGRDERFHELRQRNVPVADPASNAPLAEVRRIAMPPGVAIAGVNDLRPLVLQLDEVPDEARMGSDIKESPARPKDPLGLLKDRGHVVDVGVQIRRVTVSNDPLANGSRTASRIFGVGVRGFARTDKSRMGD